MKLEITKKDPANEVKVKLKHEVLLSPEFQALRNKIKYKTRYHVIFDEDKLIVNCIHQIKIMDAVPVSKIFIRLSKLDIASK